MDFLSLECGRVSYRGSGGHGQDDKLLELHFYEKVFVCSGKVVYVKTVGVDAKVRMRFD